MHVASLLLFLAFVSKAKACSRQIKVKNLLVHQCNIPPQLTHRCMQLRELCGYGVSQLDNHVICDTADLVCDETRKLIQNCYSNTSQLNAVSNNAVSDKETIEELTKNRFLLGSNRTMKLVTENELQTHSMKMHQITNLSAVIYNQEQPSMVKPLEEQILNLTDYKYDGLLYNGDLWLTDPQADIIIKTMRQLAETATRRPSGNVALTVSSSATSSTTTSSIDDNLNANVGQSSGSNAVSSTTSSAKAGTITFVGLNAAAFSTTTKTSSAGNVVATSNGGAQVGSTTMSGQIISSTTAAHASNAAGSVYTTSSGGVTVIAGGRVTAAQGSTLALSQSRSNSTGAAVNPSATSTLSPSSSTSTKTIGISQQNNPSPATVASTRATSTSKAGTASGVNGSSTSKAVGQSINPTQRTNATSPGSTAKIVSGRKRRKRQIIASNSDWSWNSKQRIRYLIDAELATYSKALDFIHEAFEFWQNETCFTFEEGFPDGNANFIFVANGPFIFAEIGRKGFAGATEKQTKISLPAASINFGTVAHAIGHALGLWHEENRPDSENFVAFNEKNGNPLDEIFPCSKDLCQTLNIPYDFGSNFHLGLDFLQPKDKNFDSAIGQQHFEPTFYDLKIINDFYCPAIPCNSRLDCWNGGYPHPKTCGECICPDGMTGKFCNESMPGEPMECGGHMMADNSWRQLESPNLANTETLDPSQKCAWHIEAPNGTIVELQFADNTFGFPAYIDPTTGRIACEWNHVELRLQNDMANTGYRFCGKIRPLEIFKSVTNRAMVLLQAPYDPEDRRESEGFQLLYRFAEN